MILNEQIKKIHQKKNSFPLYPHGENMRLLENKVLFWSKTNKNPKYALIELLKETNESLDSVESFRRNRIIRNFDNIIYFLDENTLDDIIKGQYTITDKELNNFIVESCKDIKFYNRVKSNIQKLNKKVGFVSHLKEYSEYVNYPTFIKEEYMEAIVKSIIESYDSLEDKVLYSIMNECLLVSNIINKCNIDSKILVEESTKAFVHFRNIDKQDIIYVQEHSKLQSDNKRLLYLLTEEKTEETKEGLKITKKKSLKDMISGFELENNKSVEGLKSFMKKIYSTPLDDIINESPFILGFIRKFFIVGGSFIVNPILGIVMGLTDFLIEKTIDRKSAEKHLKHLESEKNKAEKKLDKLKSETHIENTKKYIDQLEKNIEKVEKYIDDSKSDKEKSAEWDFEENTSIIDTMACFMFIEENTELLTEDSKLTEYLVEGKISNTLKLAAENLKGKAKSLTGKEKLLSQRLDGLMDGFVRNIESALTNKKREDIIKGRILPSFSRMMKMGIVAGAAFAVNPLLAAIGAVGSMAVSKAATVREKQFILDEIDINLKIVDKKIQQAEINGDDKTLEDLYKLQMRLTREKQRIKYNMKVYYKA